MMLINPTVHMTDPLTEFITPEVMDDLVWRSRKILKANRNTTWNRPLGLITDDLPSVATYLQTLNTPVAADFKEKKYLGYYWRSGLSGAAIWVKPRHDCVDTVLTLCHEIAHGLTKSVHGRVWRHAYAMLLPLFLTKLTDEQYATPPELVRPVALMVKRYAVRLHSRQRMEEINWHLDTIERLRDMNLYTV